MNNNASLRRISITDSIFEKLGIGDLEESYSRLLERLLYQVEKIQEREEKQNGQGY
ncbi:MAG TPA: hypothetical protein VH500_04030 [Nitrososphaeraceae archaeon]|jgi:hypothetical protein